MRTFSGGRKMVLDVYLVGELTTALERKQMDRLIGYLSKEFENRRESCILVIEPTIPYFCKSGQLFLRKNGQPHSEKPDALIIKDNIFVLIELKGLKGEIPVDFDVKTKVNYENVSTQKVSIDELMCKAIKQAKGHRIALISYLATKFGEVITYPIEVEANKKGDYIAQNIITYVVTEEEATLKYINNDKKPRYLDVISLEKIVYELKWLKNTKNLLQKDHINHFLTELNAKYVLTKEWYRGALHNSEITIGFIPKIIDWIDTNKQSEIIKALKAIKELELTNHLSLVFKCWKNQNATVRQEALSIIIEWQPEEINTTLKEALQDIDHNIRETALDHIEKNRHIKNVETLLIEYHHHHKRQEDITPQERIKAIKVITASYTEALRKIFQEYTQEFQGLKITENKDKYPVLLMLIRAVGIIGYKESIPWFKQIIENPSIIGFESDNYNKLSDDLEYLGIFKETCIALSNIAIDDKDVVNLLIFKLNQAPEKYQQSLICALGRLGNSIAGPALLPFIKKIDNPLYNDAIQAITNMGYNKKVSSKTSIAIIKKKQF